MLPNTAPQQLNVLQAATEWDGNLMGTMFSVLSGCTINIIPQNFGIILQPNIQTQD